MTAPWLLSSTIVTLLCAFLAYRVYRQARGLLLQHVYVFLASFWMVYVVALFWAAEYVEDSFNFDTVFVVYATPILCLITIGAGYALGTRTMLANVWTAWARKREVVPGRALPFAICVCAIGVLGELFFISLSGGRQEYFSVARGAGDYESTTAYLYSARWLVIPGLAILIGLTAAPAPKWVSRLALLVWSGGFAYQVVLGQRSGIFAYAILGLALLTISFRRRLGIAQVVLVLALAFLMIGFLRVARQDFYIGSDFGHVQNLIEQPLALIVQRLSMAQLVSEVEEETGSKESTVEIRLFALYIDTIPRVIDYDYGEFYLDHFVHWIPRIVWPARPDVRQPKKEEIERFLGRGMCHICGPTPTMVGMFWLNGGLTAVIVLSLFTGLFLSFFDANGRAEGLRNPIGIAFLLCFAGESGNMAMGLGPLASLPSWLPFGVAPVLLFLVVGTRRRVHGVASAGHRAAGPVVV